MLPGKNTLTRSRILYSKLKRMLYLNERKYSEDIT